MKEGAGESELLTKKRTQTNQAQRAFSVERQVSTDVQVAGDGIGVAEEHTKEQTEEHTEEHTEQQVGRQAMLEKRKAYLRRMQERQLKD